MLTTLTEVTVPVVKDYVPNFCLKIVKALFTGGMDMYKLHHKNSMIFMVVITV